MRVSVVVTSLVDAQVGAHAVLNACNPELGLGSGVRGDVREACGGATYQRHVRERLEEEFGEPLRPEDCLVTGSGTATAFRWVLHVASVDYRRADPETRGVTGPSRVRLCFRAALAESVALAREHGLSGQFVLATPLLGAGHGGLGDIVSLDMMMGAVADHLRERPSEEWDVLARDEGSGASATCRESVQPETWAFGVSHPIIPDWFAGERASAMTNEYRSPEPRKGGGTQLEARRNSRCSPWRSLRVMFLLLLGMQTACATGSPMSGRLVGGSRHEWRVQRTSSRPQELADPAQAGSVRSTVETFEALEGTDAGAEERKANVPVVMGAAGGDEREDLEEKSVGWPDGVGDGRPFEVPMTLDYFQGFLAQAGVPSTALPGDGRTLSPRQAMELVPHLISTQITLGNFGLRRMAVHLLLEVASGGERVTRSELHARMQRFSRLLVLRPDGYLVRVTSGVAVQKAGEVVLAEDGALRAGSFEVGPFYAIAGEQLFPVDPQLEVSKGARPTGPYEPDDHPALAVAEGAVLAVVDMVEGLHRLVFYTGETLESLAQLPGSVRFLYESSPRLWEEFRHKPYAEKVRTISRLATGMILTVGTSGAGAAKAASWGNKLGSVSVPLLSLSDDGLLAVRLVAVPVGGAVALAGSALNATYVLHMANMGAQGGNGWPPSGGPGKWEPTNESMSEESRCYQCQVTGAPPGWVYRVWRNGEKADFDGYSISDGVLQDGKAFNYAKHYDEKLDPKRYFQGARKLLETARRQTRVANGLPIRWYVAEEKMVGILKKMLEQDGLLGIEVIHAGAAVKGVP